MAFAFDSADCRSVPKDRQTICCSVRWKNRPARLVNDYMRNPVGGSRLGSQSKPPTISRAGVREVPSDSQHEALERLLASEFRALSCIRQYKRGTERVARIWAREGFRGGLIHGDRHNPSAGALDWLQTETLPGLVATMWLHVVQWKTFAHSLTMTCPRLRKTSFTAWAVRARRELRCSLDAVCA